MPKRNGTLEIIDMDLAGRIGRLHLHKTYIETPAFFPVVDPIRQELPLDDIWNAGFNQIITNAYLAYKRWGYTQKSIHEILRWNGAIMTDSGAYQILAYGNVDVDQDTILEYQKYFLKPDIGVILDVPTGDVNRQQAIYTVNETLRRARLALRRIDPERDDVLWVLPIQGGKHVDLVEKSAREGAKLPYRMYGIGSPTVFLERYRYDVVIKIIAAAKKHLNPSRPVHLFGAGHPLIIPFAVALGVDTFDSASYMLYARDDRYITQYGVYRLEDLDYFPCSCPVCARYTPQELREMPKPERTRLLALHNLYAISQTIKRVKQAIREGRLWELLQENARAHPAAARALSALRGTYTLLEVHTPRVKPRLVRAIRAYGPESLWNPRLLRYKSTILTKYVPGLLDRIKASGNPTLRLKLSLNPPEDCKSTKEHNDHVIFYTPFLGVIPEELCGAYPTIHLNYPYIDSTVAKDVSNAVSIVVSHALARGIRVIVEVDDSSSIGLAVLAKLSRRTRRGDGLLRIEKGARRERPEWTR